MNLCLTEQAKQLSLLVVAHHPDETLNVDVVLGVQVRQRGPGLARQIEQAIVDLIFQLGAVMPRERVSDPRGVVGGDLGLQEDVGLRPPQERSSKASPRRD